MIFLYLRLSECFVFPKNRGRVPPKMDIFLVHGKTPIKMDDLGGTSTTNFGGKHFSIWYRDSPPIAWCSRPRLRPLLSWTGSTAAFPPRLVTHLEVATGWSLLHRQHQSHRIHVQYIYLHEWLMFMVNVGKYPIHGSHGISKIENFSVFMSHTNLFQ